MVVAAAISKGAWVTVSYSFDFALTFATVTATECPSSTSSGKLAADPDVAARAWGRKDLSTAAS